MRRTLIKYFLLGNGIELMNDRQSVESDVIFCITVQEIFAIISIGVFCAHKPNFLMLGHIATWLIINIIE